MRSRRDDVDPALAVRRALEQDFCGMGEPLDERDERWVDRFCEVPEGSFVWTRSDEGFHLGRLIGPCCPDASPAALAADLVHVRPCDWLPGPVDPALVPEQVTYSFSRGGRNFQRIGLNGAAEATEDVWRRLG